jgi:hypothetical protein
MALDSLHFNSLMATLIKFETKTNNLVFAISILEVNEEDDVHARDTLFQESKSIFIAGCDLS